MPTDAGRSFDPGRYTLLLVDSDVAARRQLAALLQGVGYVTREFGSAEALLDCVDELPDPCCVISETTLPGLSGLDLLRTLRSRQRNLPVMMLTRDEDVGVAVDALRSHASDYLTRPFADRDLVIRLRRILAGH
jgi:FixJ family two-component response regulator